MNEKITAHPQKEEHDMHKDSTTQAKQKKDEREKS